MSDDLETDPFEIDNIYDRPEIASLIDHPRDELARLQDLVGDDPHSQ